MGEVVETIDQLKALYPLQPEVAHHFGGGVYAKETIVPKGMRLMQHRHSYDHLSVLASGIVVVRCNDSETVYTAPACITIAANKFHEVEAIEDSVWFCIHATDCTDSEHVDNVLIGE